MPRYSSTASWVANQLRAADWESRHELAHSIKMTRPTVYKEVCDIMAPDELLDGRLTSDRVFGTIILKDAIKPLLRQTKLEEFFGRT